MAAPLHSVVITRRVDLAETRQLRRRIGRLAGFAMLGTCAIAVPAALAAYPVIDAQNLAQSIQQLSTLGKQLTELTKIFETAEDIFGAVGKAKSTVNSVVPNSYSNVGTQVAAASPNFENWGLPKDVAPNISSVNQAIEFLQKSLDVPMPAAGKTAKPVTTAAQSEILARRDSARREVTMRALGAAQNAIATSRDASSTANNIITAPNVDLREQTAQSIQAIVGVNQELIQIRVLLATMLELEASDKLLRIPVQTGFTRAPDDLGENKVGNDPFGTAN